MSEQARITIRRDWNVRDDAGNSYGILDVNPDPADPAVLLGLYVAATGERRSRIVRLGDHLQQPGIDLVVAELATGEAPYLVLIDPRGDLTA